MSKQVNLLNAEHNPDMMLLAARALTFLADVMPASASSIVRHGAVTVLCARLLSIDYIDLAEQSLQALEKLSHEHPQVWFLHFKAVYAGWSTSCGCSSVTSRLSPC